MRLKKRIYLIISILVIGLIIGVKCFININPKDVGNHNSKGKLTVMNVRKFNKEILSSKNRSIPVLMYHYIRNDKNNSLATSKEKFAQQMKYISKNGYTTITLDELYAYNNKKISLPNKAVVITFDDGYKDNYENAYPILKKYKINATIFVITDFIDKKQDILTSKQIKEMSANGVDIESHTTHHDDLKGLSYKEQLKTMVDSKKVLEELVKKPVNYVAYPYGSYNENSIKACKKAGYVMAFRTHENWCNNKGGVYLLNRIYMNGNFNMKSFMRRINNSNYHFIAWRIWEHFTRKINF